MFEWRPQQGPQEGFHRSTVFELLYGGEAGGGKSESGLMEALRYIHVPAYTAMCFRRTFRELAQPKGLIERSRLIFPELGAKYNEQQYMWRFPTGATISFSHMEHEHDKEAHKSAEYAYIFFDELTTFLETQYLYLFSRCRTTAIDPRTGKVIPARMRSGSNPGDVGHEWVLNRWGAWLDNDFAGVKALSGEVRHFRRVDDVDVECAPTDTYALSRQFIRATRYDNPALMAADPTYEARLQAMPLLDRMRLAEGNWNILLQGNVFKPEWFKHIDEAPLGLKWFRYWDLAASTKTHGNYTACAAVAVDLEGNLYIRDMIRVKYEWPDAKKLIIASLTEPGLVETGIEKKLHGIAALQELAREPACVGHRIVGVDVVNDKITRALQWQDRAEKGKVYLVDGSWVNSFLLEAALFDGLGKTSDDQIDTVSGGVLMAANPRWKVLKFLHL